MRNTGGKHAADYVPRVPLLSSSPPTIIIPTVSKSIPLGSIDRINPRRPPSREPSTFRASDGWLPFTDLLIASSPLGLSASIPPMWRCARARARANPPSPPPRRGSRNGGAVVHFPDLSSSRADRPVRPVVKHYYFPEWSFRGLNGRAILLFPLALALRLRS